MADAALAALSPTFDEMYSDVGRPSIPPEPLLKACLLMALHTARSERLFCDQLDYNLLFRWFLDMGIEDPSFDHSTFSQNSSLGEAVVLDGDTITVIWGLSTLLGLAWIPAETQSARCPMPASLQHARRRCIGGSDERDQRRIGPPRDRRDAGRGGGRQGCAPRRALAHRRHSRAAGLLRDDRRLPANRGERTVAR
jgi:hypothetical protein